MSRAARGKSGRKTLQSRVKAPPKPVKLPLTPRRVWKVLIGGFVGLTAAAACVWAMVAQVPERLTMQVANMASRAGFMVRQVEISGVVNQPKLSIYREVLSGGSDSMLLIDLPETRARLVELPWVMNASIARRWPDRLEINIIERKPVAVWQNDGRLTLIDRNGTPLPSDRLEDFADLPQIIGPNAHQEATMFLKLMANEPQIADRLKAATWIGNRRWDLLMQSGETVSLPEGPEAAAALKHFAALDRETPLLGQGFVRFDLRIPDKMVVRVSDETGAKAKPRARPQAQTTPAGGWTGQSAGRPEVAI